VEQMSKQIDIYKSLINDFCKETNQYKNKIDIPGIFIPHGLSKYNCAKKKYFYIGRDTNDWCKFNELITFYEENNIEKYIEENNWPTSSDEFLEYTNNSQGGFWTLAAKLHLKLNGIQEDIQINTQMKNEYKEILEEMGYGNLNSIETKQSLQNRSQWESIDKSIYEDIKQKSKRFDRLKLILDIYNPDYIFIFNWDADENLAFTDLQFERLEHQNIENVCSVYYVKENNTKIIWTIHPNNLRFKGMNINDLITIILERL